MSPANRRKMAAAMSSDPMSEDSEAGPEAGPEGSPEDEAQDATEPQDRDPMSDGSVGADVPKLTAPADILGGATAGDILTFKIVSIDPKTGDGTLEAVPSTDSQNANRNL